MEWIPAGLALALALISGGVAFGMLKAGMAANRDRIDAVEADLNKLAVKIESMNGHRLEDLREEVKKLRDWRHFIEDTRAGRRLMGLDPFDDRRQT